MSKHKTVPEVFGRSHTELATLLGDLRYDELAAVLGALGTKIRKDAQKDRAGGRAWLATRLETLAAKLAAAKASAERVWSICAKHM